ncbi:ankyrin repeat domain-containing protein [Flavobacterium zepuense]|uniref:Ankyrin repeat domain-containing protein n=1 Tax=Flavobacterium zepuense TaxID=2593302 RepID=A0A552UVV6_9FLAO|nr:ankyrin repeat domain-containing protein [Flavobacterium zepuense]TRW22371.1 ankyrin repeat domain-containing protein [Flavobacterium zepuense]
MKKILLLIAFISSTLCNAQGKDVFDTARSGTVAEMQLLVKKNKDTINALNPAGFSPLILACYRGNAPVAEYLAKNVKDINYNSSNGTALASVAVKGDVPLAKVLLENKANPNIADPSGVTPLVYAVQFQNKELIALLLKYKADKNQKDKDGKSAYDHALFLNNQEIINLFK